jgi:regulator of protease activity HflC (stomatin/prohibitin superfamily)
MTKEKCLYNAYYSTEDPLRQMEQHIDSYFRTFAAKHTLKEMLLEQNTMSGELLTLLNREMKQFGFLVCRSMVTDIDPPPEIKRTMNSVLTSQNTRQAMINEAEGKKTAAILEAEGLCRVKELEGEGLSLQRKALANGLNETMKNFGQTAGDMDANTLTSTILTMQYIDMLNHASQNGNNSFILSSNPLGAVSMEEQLKTSFLATRK